MHTYFDSVPHYRPYRWAGPEFQIGLQPIAADEWLCLDAGYSEFMRAKRAHVDLLPARYYKTLPCSLAAQRELRHLVATHLAAYFPDAFVLSDSLLTALPDGNTLNLFDESEEPLRQLSRLVQEDFMLVEEIDGRHTITAAANAYSSSGRLVASVGNNLRWAHEPVPNLTASLGRRIDRIIASAHEASPCARFNWQLTPVSNMFFPPDPHTANLAALQTVRARLAEAPALAGELLHVRVERQTLRRLPATGAVAFSIHTYSDPLECIASDPLSVLSMLKLLRQYSLERLRYTEMEGIRDAVITWLEQLLERDA